MLQRTETTKAFYSSNLELHATGILGKNFRDVRSDQCHFMQLQTARQRKEETPQEFLDRCLSLAMKTVPTIEDLLVQKFHYDQTQRMSLSAFTAGLSGNPGQRVRFKMPAIVDQALQIPITVFEAEAQEKRNLIFFSNSETRRISRGNSGQPWKTLGDQSTDRLLGLAQTRRMQARSNVSKIHARLTLAAKGNCFVLSVGNRDTFPRTAF